jgi:hypothetical protein
VICFIEAFANVYLLRKNYASEEPDEEDFFPFFDVSFSLCFLSSSFLSSFLSASFLAGSRFFFDDLSNRDAGFTPVSSDPSVAEVAAFFPPAGRPLFFGDGLSVSIASSDAPSSVPVFCFFVGRVDFFGEGGAFRFFGALG